MGLFNKQKNTEPNNSNIWGGFVFSKNIYKRKPVRFTYREQNDNPALNGWTLYSCDDDDEYNKLYDAEYNWDIAIKNYCNQQNTTADKLNDTDKEIIWKYCYSEIDFLVMWLLENDFFVADKSIQETANLVKTRKATPDLLMNTIDGKLMADDLKEEIVDFVRNYLEEDETIKVEYSKFVENKTKKQVKGYEEFYSFVFKWDDYEYFKPYIVDSYKRYIVTGTS